VDPNVIFYLASTVAQALPSFAGFLGAFVLFQMQGQAASLKAAGEMICDGVGGAPQLRHVVAAGNYDEFITRVQTLIDQDPNALAHDAVFFTGMLDHFQRLLAKHQAAIGPFKVAMIWTAPILVGSLVMILAAPQIARTGFLAYVLSAALIAGLSWCSWLYWTVVRASLERN